jgi:phage shock protein E
MSRWRLAALLGGAIMVLVVFALLGMPGMDYGTSTGSETTRAAAGEVAELTPQQFDQALHAPDAVVINVHVPYEGEIEGTDTHIRYDEIGRSDDLPTDVDRPILLYCRSGRMSRIAGATLVEAGYTNVVHLSDGMEAWTASGRSLFNEPSRSRRRRAGQRRRRGADIRRSGNHLPSIRADARMPIW